MSAKLAGVPTLKESGAPAKSRSSKRTTKKKDLEVIEPRRGVMGLLAPVALASIFGVLLLMAMFHALVVQGQRELDRVRSDIEAAETTNDRLVLDLAEAEAPQRIVAAARDFGMVDAPEVVYLSPENNSTPSFRARSDASSPTGSTVPSDSSLAAPESEVAE